MFCSPWPDHTWEEKGVALNNSFPRFLFGLYCPRHETSLHWCSLTVWWIYRPHVSGITGWHENYDKNLLFFFTYVRDIHLIISFLLAKLSVKRFWYSSMTWKSGRWLEEVYLNIKSILNIIIINCYTLVLSRQGFTKSLWYIWSNFAVSSSPCRIASVWKYFFEEYE